MNSRLIPFHRPSIGDAEIAAVAAVMRSGWLTTGPVTAEFESRFSDYIGAPHALAVNSCSSGLQLALRALGVGSGDEVITSPLTFCATVHAIIHVGATPVLADVAANGNIDPKLVESRITPRTKAIIAVHLGGNPCQMEALWELARRHGLFVVEDAAHALSARYSGNYVEATRIGGDSRSDAVVFSFYATKSLTTGEGGMVTTHRRDLADRLRVLGNQGIGVRHGWKYQVVDVGFKFNLSDIQSAIGIEQLKRQEEFLARRLRCANIYHEALSDIEASTSPGNCRHLFRITVASRAEFIERMVQLGVECSVHFIPISAHPAFSALGECPRAMEIYRESVSLPIYPSMSDEDARYVGQCVRDCIK